MTEQELKKILDKSKIETSKKFTDQLILQLESIEEKKTAINFPFHFILFFSILLFVGLGLIYIYANTTLSSIPKLPFLLFISLGMLLMTKFIFNLRANNSLIMQA